MSLSDARRALLAKEISASELTDACLKRITAVNPELFAYLEVFEDEARHAAAAADGKLAASSEVGPLEGIPIAVKDNLLNAGHAVTAASKILERYRAAYSATVLEKIRAAGAVILGRTNMDEFAMGSSTESSAFGATKNPWDVLRVPGGSSGGSAAAVAADLCIAALGSDTGGSIRQPAALCGVVGLKPTYGRVSRYGLIAMASSLDQIGPLAKTVEDAAALLSVIEGEDQRDSTTASEPPTDWKRRADLKGVRVGIPQEYQEGIADLPMGAAIEKAVAKLRELGAEVKEISLPHAPYALAVYYVLMPAEVSSNLARFDGVRYGPRAAGENLLELYRQTRGAFLGDEARRRIMLGTYALSAGYYDAYYRKAQEARTLVKQDYRAAFTQVDVLVAPTSPTTAWPLGEKFDDPLAMYLADVDTVSANVAGLPAITIPCGLLDGLPAGLQFIGPAWSEGMLFSVADCAERAFEFRKLKVSSQ
ncbi:Asp-tRNA(Asn)/Glu-tRNA(Gln) amidotransferase subunit GatA [Patescibacteria group bacterium]|nr:MAG: Asp-tRNA(Asn)/Glu-tRNA(Gln) amidotransferase subunit GatA [Patescibacteria group bacterium]